ncbi:MAG: isoleucine--tRNA ligase [Myxococcales bacterium]|nr:MAG: isoleucine--tRNA ligase [Myxococcales bacterium]
MYRKVETWVDVVAMEHRILEFWKETQAFEKLRRQLAGKPKWSFLDGPITANNPMGVHHAWGRTLKDLFQRYWAMNGRDQRYQNGFDCQGLWVEVEVEKQLGFATKREIEAYGVDRFVEMCKQRVRKYSGIQSEQSIRLGYWMDWSDSYYTMSDENNYTIWAFLKKCHQRGKLYRGVDVMPWSGRSGTGYSQMEVVEGRRLVAHEALFLKFPLRGRPKENLLVWTTTPWTLSSNVAAAVNPELEYVRLRAKRDGEIYYFAAENLQYQRLEREFKEKKEWVEGVPKLKTLEQIFKEQGGYEILGYLRGAEMVGWEYDGPFDELEAQAVVGGYPFIDAKVALSGKTAHRVIDGGRDSRGAATVVVGEGTGIVHTAPGCGDIDHVIGKALGLPQIAPLDDEAKFIDKFGPLTGRHALVPETVEWIFRNLKEKGLLVHKELYPHVYPHCWRSGDPLVFRLVDEWYINMDWRDEIKAIVKQIKWIPEWGQERELEWLSNMRDWMISKKRYWGLALPIWVCEKCKAFEVIGGREELKARAIAGWDKFEGHSPHKPWIDEVKIACQACGGAAHRIPDVGNPWLDAGIVPYSTVRYNTDRDYWKKWIPADLVLECFPGQFRNWFYSLLAMSTMMENVPPFKTLVGHALVRDEEGREMHKSSGNAIWFDDAAEQMGADIMRWIYGRHETTTNLNFGYGVAREVRGKFYNTLWNTYSFFVNYARLDGFVPEAARTPVATRPDFDRWILSNLQLTVRKVRESIEAWTPRLGALAIETFVEDLSNWYVRHNRRRYWKGKDDLSSRMAYETLYECLETLNRLIAPYMPFTAEEIYQNLVRSHDAAAPESVHHCGFPVADEALVDQRLSDDMAVVQRLTNLALSAREAAKQKVRQPLALLSIGPTTEPEREAALRFKAMLAEDLNVKKVDVLAVGAPSPTQVSAKPNFKTLGKRLGAKMKALQEAIAARSETLAKDHRAGQASFEIALGDETVVLAAEDLLVESGAPAHLAVAEENGLWMAFDTTLSDELRLEGLMRELLRRLQVQRKDVGLEIEDRIAIVYDGASPKAREIFARFDALLKEELLALDIREGDASGGAEHALGGERAVVLIRKAG